MSFKIGLKIWSTNHDSFVQLFELYRKKRIQYVELYIVPNSFNEKKLYILKQIPIIFHAPNFSHGFNLSDKNQVFESAVDTILEFVNFFNEKKIIFHPGFFNISEAFDTLNAIANINSLKSQLDIILENVPRLAIDKKTILLASHPSDFNKIIKDTEIKWCLDIGHAIYSANFYQENIINYLELFFKMAPFMYHFADGNYKNIFDLHNHFGEGSFPLFELFKRIPKNSRISLETPKTDLRLLSEDKRNLDYLYSKLLKVFQ
jgi:endonuclease IV